MNPKNFPLLLLFILTGCSAENTLTAWPEITREAKPMTRWWWMGSDVDSAGITYNLEAMSRAGIGGVEITPIYGVKGREDNYIDYLSPRWMNMLAFTLAEARRLNMSVDMNNGTGWPFGGPDVSVDDAASKLLRIDGRIETGKTGQTVKRAAPGGEGFVLDHLNKDAVERYLDKFDTAFASNKTPFPQSFFNDSYEVYGADWTASLPDEFERRRGYRIEQFIPQLFSDGATDTAARVIADYRETIADMLLDNFALPWTDRARRHGATTRYQAHGSPASLIDLYAAADIPECESFGITDFDIPGLRRDSIRRINDGDPAVLKFASSAAHIAGRKLASAETFTWLTEHFRTSLSQCKPELDLMLASGVNHVVFHGSTYSPQDAPWPGWKFYASVDISPTNTIWRDAPAFFSYIARTLSFLQSGRPDADFLLYFPIYDIRHEQRGNHYLSFPIHGLRERFPQFCAAVDSIMAAGYDADYISDRFIRSCSVENKLIRTAGGNLYKALIIPAARRMPPETLAHILEMARQGATIWFAGEVPSDAPGLFRHEERKDSIGKIINCLLGEKTVTVRAGSVIPTGFEQYAESFANHFGGKMIRRKHEAGHTYFFAMLRNESVDGWMRLGTIARSAIFFDPMSGETGKAEVRTRNGASEVYMQLRPGQSIILKTFSAQNPAAPRWMYHKPTGRAIRITSPWSLRFVQSDPPVHTQFLLDKLTSWTELPNDTLKINRGSAIYSTTFSINKQLRTEYRLILHDVRESAAVTVNGRSAGTLFASPFEVNIGSLLSNGDNFIEIEATNLPANRIADYDRRNIIWRNFHEINFVGINYRNESFGHWGVMPSGLEGEVWVEELEIRD